MIGIRDVRPAWVRPVCEERLQRALGTQVKLERSRAGGRIVIRFDGDDDLVTLVQRLLGDEG